MSHQIWGTPNDGLQFKKQENVSATFWDRSFQTARIPAYKEAASSWTREPKKFCWLPAEMLWMTGQPQSHLKGLKWEHGGTTAWYHPVSRSKASAVPDPICGLKNRMGVSIHPKYTRVTREPLGTIRPSSEWHSQKDQKPSAGQLMRQSHKDDACHCFNVGQAHSFHNQFAQSVAIHEKFHANDGQGDIQKHQR